ncbi:uncharacterized protein C8Q71DRAFT_758292 [Rhodofomes roseus]|uniref:Uncharacterized protein n=1 Tax=Rhodofomes roseus TaxID=34475 RepID=A0ABQ8KG01_9APHY|nr:uncharacterized protein C8Q71DRAFT_758292 [Rhodofomes roseus]KAH9836512.1 hypothetical protein C8Q71DRAFT_758292 [Rhodofomes roseus]
MPTQPPLAESTPDEELLLADLSAVLSSLKRLRPLAPSASPEARSVRRRLGSTVADLIPAVNTCVQQGFFPGDDGGDTEPAPTVRAPSTVLRRLEKICKHDGSVPLPTSAMVNVIAALPPGSHATAEDAGLAILLRGYEDAELAEWQRVLEPLRQALPSSAEFRAGAAKAAHQPDVGQRLVERHATLETFSAARQRSHMLHLILQHVEVLKFASDWCARTGKGSRAYKRNFNRSTFRQLPHIQPQLQGLSRKDIDNQLNGPLNTELTQWIRRNEPVITARNRLLEMYNHFGALILLDPLWDVAHLALHRSSTFADVYRALANATPAHDRRARHELASRVLLSVVATLGEADDAAFVQAFLRDYTPASMS